MKVAIVHEWLEHFAGSERVVEQLLVCFPQADLFAVVDFMPEAERGWLGGRRVQTSFIQKLPLARKMFRKYLQLMPLAVEQFDLAGYDLVISSHHAVAKGVITGPDQIHVSYVHSPMRYAWDLQAQYLRQAGMERGVASLYTRWLLHRLRIWDCAAAARVDVFAANSRYIGRRIAKAYRREARVVWPPVAVENFVLGAGRREGYLVVSRFVPYKRVELIVEAFAKMPGRRLTVVGAGDGAELVRRAAAGATNIELMAPVPGDRLVALMQSARAMVFAAEEDFGITMVEAQACGAPVIAYGAGGAADIIDAEAAEPTGLLFAAQTADAIVAAVERFEAMETRITASACRANAMRFSEEMFRSRMTALVEEAMANGAGAVSSRSRNAPEPIEWTTLPDRVDAVVQPDPMFL